MKLLMIACLLLLSGCVGMQQQAMQKEYEEKMAQFTVFNQETNAKRSAGEIGYAEGQKKKWAYWQTLWPNDPYGAEFFTYTIMLGEKVDKGEISASEYSYLAVQKNSELHERAANDQAKRAQATAAMMQAMPAFRPIQVSPPPRLAQPAPRIRQTNCYSDNLGNTRCTTY